MIDYIGKALFAQYGLNVYAMKEVPGGWSASAFIVQTDKGEYFVKVYDKHRPSVQPWIQRMALYMPAVLWLSANTPLKDKMIAPILAKNAAYKVENINFVLVVFPYVDGKTLCETQLTSEQISQLADILALLHSYGEKTPVPTEQLVELYTLPFLDSLNAAIHADNMPFGLRKALQTHSHEITQAVRALQLLAERMRLNPPLHVLCHTDIHGWNLMWGNRLILIDWEGLRLAPVESDLFSFSDGFFFGYAKEEFFAAYQKVCPGYTVNETAMNFYRLRRRLEDIAEFAHSMINDNLTASEREKSLFDLQKECAALGGMISHI